MKRLLNVWLFIKILNIEIPYNRFGLMSLPLLLRLELLLPETIKQYLFSPNQRGGDCSINKTNTIYIEKVKFCKIFVIFQFWHIFEQNVEIFEKPTVTPLTKSSIDSRSKNFIVDGIWKISYLYRGGKICVEISGFYLQ